MLVKTPGDLGHLVREARRSQGLSQAALAARAGTTQSWISEIESGKETAEVGKVLRLLSFLRLSLDVAPAGEVRSISPGLLRDFPSVDPLVGDDGS